MKKCGKARQYKGLIKPTYNGGKGCDHCNIIWREKCPHKIEDLEYGPDALGNNTNIFCGSCGNLIKSVNPKPFNNEFDFLFEKLLEIKYKLDNVEDRLIGVNYVYN